MPLALEMGFSSWTALIPFLVLVTCFAALRISLLYSAYIGLLSSCLITQGIFHADTPLWTLTLQKTGVFMVEIGLILLGAFFFIEVARRTQVLDSVAELIREYHPDRLVQAVLLTFPIEWMIEGSSGFGTPILLVAPLLLSMGFSPLLSATLPFVSVIVAIPYGALGTPLRLGFPGSNEALATLSQLTTWGMIPAVFLAPWVSTALVLKLDTNASHRSQGQTRNWRRFALWLFCLSATYAGVSLWLSARAPEFTAAGAAWVTFLAALGLRKLLQSSAQPLPPIRAWRGIAIYGGLILFLAIGKWFWLEERFELLPVRKFNPGWGFILAGVLLLISARNSNLWAEALVNTGYRARRTLIVFFCMTWTVQQMQVTGALHSLGTALPAWLLDGGTPLAGWLGSMIIGTSTLSNLFLSPLYAAPLQPALAVGSAIGVQMAFQSITAARSILHDAIEERSIFRVLAPLSLAFVLIWTLIHHYWISLW